MSANTAGGGLLDNVRRQLSQGRSDDAIVADLIAGGLSRQSAERFVLRAGGGSPVAAVPPPMRADVLPPPLPVFAQAPAIDAPPLSGGAPDLSPPLLPGEAPSFALPNSPPAAPEPTTALPNRAWIGVIGGALTLTLGLAAMAWALSQDRNVRLRLPLFIAVTGGSWLLHATRSAVDRQQPATWLLPGIASIPPLLAFVVVLGTLAVDRPRAAGSAAVDPSGAVEAPAAPARPAGRQTTRPPTREERIARSVALLEGRTAGDPCDAAYALAQVGAREQAPILERHLSEATTAFRKICMAHSLAQLGEGDAMMNHYLEWSVGEDDQLRHHAIVGFGHVGPGAAADAMPVLEQIVAGGTTAARRFTIVKTLARLGPASRPLLQTLARDDDPQVQAAAQTTLDSLR
jgi:hypothetical protein